MTLSISLTQEFEPFTKEQFELAEPVIVRMMNRDITRKKASAEIARILSEAGVPLVPVKKEEK